LIQQLTQLARAVKVAARLVILSGWGIFARHIVDKSAGFLDGNDRRFCLSLEGDFTIVSCQWQLACINA
jgi:hypothetical protein